MAKAYLSPGVYIEELEQGSRPIEAVGTSTAAFLGESAKGPVNEAVFVSNWSSFTRVFGDFEDAPVLAHAVYGFFANGGSRLFVCNVREAGAGGARDSAEGSGNIGGSGREKAAPQESAQSGASSNANLGSKQGEPAAKLEGTASSDSGTKSGATAKSELAAKSKAGAKEIGAPNPQSKSQEAKAAPAAAYIGHDGGPGKRSGVHVFNEFPEISLVAAPGQSSPAVQEALLSHCEQMKQRFAVLDCPEDIGPGGLPQLARARDSKHGATYFPWVQVADPKKGTVWVPPSGHVAGLFARSDSERGVHKAPANEVLRGVLSLRHSLSRSEQDLLNPRGINCIRDMGDRGIRVWGARTLSSDPAWRYVNVRRLLMMIEQSIEQGTQWVVFEPNDEGLWKRVCRNVSAFLLRVHTSGALAGSTPEEAFYVKCDAETNPQEVIDAGQMVCEVGVAPVKPAEFVIFRIGQMAGVEA